MCLISHSFINRTTVYFLNKNHLSDSISTCSDHTLLRKKLDMMEVMIWLSIPLNYRESINR